MADMAGYKRNKKSLRQFVTNYRFSVNACFSRDIIFEEYIK